MKQNNKGPLPDPAALGQQFWQTWTDFARQQAGSAGDAFGKLPNWHEGLEWWAKLTGTRPANDAAHAVEQMSQHGQKLFEMMQGLASGLGSGKPLSAADITERWQQMFGAAGNPMLDTLSGIAADGARGWDQLGAGFEPLLGALRGERNAALGLPAFGLLRERQEHWQVIARAQAEYVERQADYQALLAKASQRGLALFEAKLAERSEPGRQIDSVRGLYDLWIDAAEEAYAEVAMSPEFRAAYGAMVNAQMRLKQGLQRELDRQVGELGLPTRAELDGAHRKIHALQRELRELRALLRTPAAREPAGEPRAARAAAKPTTGTARTGTAKAAAGKTTKRPAAKRAPATPAAGTRRRARKET